MLPYIRHILLADVNMSLCPQSRGAGRLCVRRARSASLWALTQSAVSPGTSAQLMGTAFVSVRVPRRGNTGGMPGDSGTNARKA